MVSSQETSGGWMSVQNIINSIGRGAEALVSPFFPTPQKKTPTVSQINEQAGNDGLTYRPVIKENQSMVETNQMYAQSNFLGTQYEERFNPPAKVRESKNLSASVSQTETDWISGSLDWALQQSKKVDTIVDYVIDKWHLKPREPISEGPSEIGNSPCVIANMQPSEGETPAAETKVSRVTGIIDQVKGLFNLAFGGPTGPQPVNEIDSKQSLGIAAIIILALFLLVKK